MSDGRRRAALAACVLAGAVLRVARVAEAPFVHADAPALLRIAREELTGERWRTALAGYYPPLYPAAIRAVHALGADWETAGRAVSCAAGVATVALAGALGVAVLGSAAGAGSAALAALHPGLVHASAEVLAESLYGALVLGWALLILPRTAPRAVALAAAGITGALAAHVRAEGIALVPLASLAAAWGAPPGRRLRRALVPLGAAAVILVPVFATIRVTTGSWAVSGKEAPVILRKYAVENGTIAGLLLRHPRAFLAIYPHALARQVEYAAGATHGLLLIPLAVGLAAVPARARRARGLVLTTIALFMLAIPILAPGKRYVVPLVPLLLPWMVPGIARLAAAARDRGLPRSLLAAGAAVAVMGLVAQGLWPPDREEERCYRALCALAGRRLGAPLPALLADDTRIAWACDTRFILRPRGATGPALAAVAHRTQAGLVVVPTGGPARTTPGLRWLGTRCAGQHARDLFAVEPAPEGAA